MNRPHRLFWVGLVAVALSACGDDTAKSKSNNEMSDVSIADVGADTSPGDNASSNSTTPDMGPTSDLGGGDDMSSADMGPDVTIDPRLCGNGMLDPGEECDDANDNDDDECNSDCTFTCGDGVVGPAEQCDIAIPEGMEGACPTSCDDGDACTTNALQGNECQAQCITGTIAACVDGDGCCPSTCDTTNDSDCVMICGNGVIEGTETCDGNCPLDCDDGIACTADVMIGSAATCDVVCMNTPITVCVDNDGCCGPGCDSTNDNDCSATCGNGTIEPPLETCDGNCPVDASDCDDNDVCTADSVSGTAAQCNAQCVNAPLGCIAGVTDGCCPSMCNANNDGDCAPVCGNGVVEMGEQCDDGNTNDGDGCDASCLLEGSGVAFRLSDLDLMDPHVYIQAFGCRDITNGNVPFNLSPPINGLIQNAITLDEDGDGELDLSFVIIMNPLDQTNGGTGSITVAEADCTAPMSTTTCTVDSSSGTFQTGSYTTDTSSDCLDALPNTSRPYTPAIDVSAPPCFASTTLDLTINVGGILVPLTDVQVGATYVGNPATSLASGLLRGFISEDDADSILLPSDLPLVGGDPLSSVLPGGTGCCAAHDDRDTGPDGTTIGWWFYLNFPADVVPVVVN